MGQAIARLAMRPKVSINGTSEYTNHKWIGKISAIY